MDNTAKYRAGFTNNATKKDFVKHTPLRFVVALPNETLNSLLLKRESYPTPIDPGTDGKK